MVDEGNRGNDLLSTIGENGLPVRRWMVEDMLSHGFSDVEVYVAVRDLDEWLRTGDALRFGKGAARLYALMVQDAIEDGITTDGNDDLEESE